jgi:hypothetical protein
VRWPGSRELLVAEPLHEQLANTAQVEESAAEVVQHFKAALRVD